MKSKLRRITVDGTLYLWRLHSPNGDGDGGIGLRVWRDKEVFLEQWFTRSKDSPWPITPKAVAALIAMENVP